MDLSLSPRAAKTLEAVIKELESRDVAYEITYELNQPFAYTRPTRNRPRIEIAFSQATCAVDRVSRWGAAGCLEGMRGAESNTFAELSEGRELLYIIFYFFLFLYIISFFLFLIFQQKEECNNVNRCKPPRVSTTCKRTNSYGLHYQTHSEVTIIAAIPRKVNDAQYIVRFYRWIATSLQNKKSVITEFKKRKCNFFSD